jgi:hypothetical protein
MYVYQIILRKKIHLITATSTKHTRTSPHLPTPNTHTYKKMNVITTTTQIPHTCTQKPRHAVSHTHTHTYTYTHQHTYTQENERNYHYYTNTAHLHTERPRQAICAKPRQYKCLVFRTVGRVNRLADLFLSGNKNWTKSQEQALQPKRVPIKRPPWLYYGL